MFLTLTLAWRILGWCLAREAASPTPSMRASHWEKASFVRAASSRSATSSLTFNPASMRAASS